MGWEPEKYIQGNYFQIETSNAFRKDFKIKPFGNILDAGCGDGQYSALLAEEVTHGRILGIDNSEEMISHARTRWARDNLSFEVDNIETFQPAMDYDFVLSFWCLHWTDLSRTFPNIFHALKNGGRFYAIFSSFSDNSVFQTCSELAKQNRYPALTKRYKAINNENNAYFYYVLNNLNQIPFKKAKVELKTTAVYFPDLNYFKSLVLTLPFIKAMPEETVPDLVDDLLHIFQTICDRKYDGKLYYETQPIVLEAMK
ncbi:methyltransferase domain-containing protein [Legionella spiritensis]|uniref:Methyltransferase n=1 Tax=Legionella spiritensis TaxID=452 RepID=A0A0W0Z600_LEGSP|nr:methyltransferase domain-containing protein [Legionella spiritensis]KTD64545.1 Methyltransferase [Legionella spiritensis]SNV29842.1 Methyltransferase [Legionella spiritensis]